MAKTLLTYWNLFNNKNLSDVQMVLLGAILQHTDALGLKVYLDTTSQGFLIGKGEELLSEEPLYYAEPGERRSLMNMLKILCKLYHVDPNANIIAQLTAQIQQLKEENYQLKAGTVNKDDTGVPPQPDPAQDTSDPAQGDPAQAKEPEAKKASKPQKRGKKSGSGKTGRRVGKPSTPLQGSSAGTDSQGSPDTDEFEHQRQLFEGLIPRFAAAGITLTIQGQYASYHNPHSRRRDPQYDIAQDYRKALKTLQLIEKRNLAVATTLGSPGLPAEDESSHRAATDTIEVAAPGCTNTGDACNQGMSA